MSHAYITVSKRNELLTINMTKMVIPKLEIVHRLVKREHWVNIKSRAGPTRLVAPVPFISTDREEARLSLAHVDDKSRVTHA